jgi:hypothetical protein
MVEKLNCCQEEDEQDFLFSTHDIVLFMGQIKVVRIYGWT